MSAAIVGDLVFESWHKAMAPVNGDCAPRADASGRSYMPQSIQATWKRDSGNDWHCRWITLYGPQIRRDGSFGTRELRETIWMNTDGTPRRISPEHYSWPIPDWALTFFAQSRPGGAS